MLKERFSLDTAISSNRGTKCKQSSVAQSLSRSAECIGGIVIVHHYPLSLEIY